MAGIDIPLVLSEIRKGAYYGWLGSKVVGQGAEDYANIDWRDERQSKPPMIEIEDAWPAVQKKYITDVDDARTAKETLIADLRKGTVDPALLQAAIADLLEGK